MILFVLRFSTSRSNRVIQIISACEMLIFFLKSPYLYQSWSKLLETKEKLNNNAKLTQKDCRNSRTKRANRIIKEEITTFQVNNHIFNSKMLKNDPKWVKLCVPRKKLKVHRKWAWWNSWKWWKIKYLIMSNRRTHFWKNLKKSKRQHKNISKNHKSLLYWFTDDEWNWMNLNYSE